MEPPDSRKLHLKKTHSPVAISSRLDSGPDYSYLKDFIYGAIDGAVTTFAVVSGVAGAGLSSGIIIVLGVANLIADGFSMAVSNFLGTRAEGQLRERTRAEEHAHIKLIPEGEREEIRQIFSRKGFSGDALERVVEVITSDPKRWADTMVQEEHGMSLTGPNPWKAASATFAAFVVIGAIPLLAFLWNGLFQPSLPYPFISSATLTGLAFFCVGALKGRYVGQRWITSGLETLLIGGGAAMLAYLIGLGLKGFADV